MTDNTPVQDASTAEQIEEHDHFGSDEHRVSGNPADLDQAGRAPFATRLRVILLLSAGSWALITIAIALVLS